MPLYDYQCQACGHSCEILHKMNETPHTECPSCHKPDLKKQVSAPQFQLKGSGWYVTDFKPGAKTASSETSKASKAEPLSTPLSTQDSKPESKAEPKTESKKE